MVRSSSGGGSAGTSPRRPLVEIDATSPEAAALTGVPADGRDVDAVIPTLRHEGADDLAIETGISIGASVFFALSWPISATVCGPAMAAAGFGAGAAVSTAAGVVRLILWQGLGRRKGAAGVGAAGPGLRQRRSGWASAGGSPGGISRNCPSRTVKVAVQARSNPQATRTARC